MKQSIEDIMKQSLKGHEFPFNGEAWLKMSERLTADASSEKKLEEVVKECLENHEMPYNPEAWQALKSKLDPRPSLESLSFYAAAAMGILLIGIASIRNISVNDHNLETSKTTTVEKSKSVHGAQEPPSNVKVYSEDSLHSLDQLTNDLVSPLNTQGSENTHDFSLRSGLSDRSVQDKFLENSMEHISDMTGHSDQEENLSFISEQLDESDSFTSNTSSSEKRTPTIPKKNLPLLFPELDNVCLGSTIAVENKNKEPIHILSPNGEVVALPQNSSMDYTPQQAGRHRLGQLNDGTFMEEGSFYVRRKPLVDFEIDVDSKYENGLPTTVARTNSGALSNSLIWKSENKVQRGKEVKFHFFQAGEHIIELSVSDEYCSSSIEKTVVTEDYQLMAVTGFRPLDTDPRKNTFIPYALTKRSTKFRMIIIDTRDGGLVFETEDVNKPWDGTDARTGEVASQVTTYVWKVVLENPEPNEPSEYRGFITKL